ncbi:MAG: uroporphyrinogen-III C-methyltransferase [Candidatus Calescibacterium sp.]|nr:uroporphyrinogen-III C-methyltransferase [Candidatus Calescibacterium sp.]
MDSKTYETYSTINNKGNRERDIDNNRRKKGKVYIVGGGPGDFLLVSLRAIKLLQEADVVIYDHLAPEIAVELFSSGEKIYVGKEASKHTLSQDQINDLLVRYALDGKKVVRFKGGDPFIFGRGGEECEYLREHGIDFEVVPGISSFYSALAYAGVPVTHRDFVSSFAVVTGSEAEKESSAIDFSALSKCGTVVFLMTVKPLPKIVNELKKYIDPKTPCIIVQNGTLANQKVVLGTLEDILQEVEENKISPPAIFAVGRVSALSKKLRWFEEKALFGKKIVITRPIDQSYQFAVMISENGGYPILFPSIKIESDENHRKNIGDFCAFIGGLDEKERRNSVIVFTSQNGVEIFFNTALELGFDSRLFFGFKIAAVGEKTAYSLRKFGIIPDLVPSDFSTQALANELIRSEIKNVFFLRAQGVRNIESELERNGKFVKNVDIYRITKHNHTEGDVKKLTEADPDILTFTSSLSFEFFSELFPKEWIMKKVIACIGRVTAKTVERILGKYPEIVSEHHTIEALFDKILEYSARNGTNS